MTTIAELQASLVDARADVTSIQSVLAEARRVADARAAASAKASADLAAAVEAQSKAEQTYADAQNDANANAMQSADRDVRVKALRSDTAGGENEKAQNAARGAEEALEKATARVASLERRIEIESSRVAASPEAVHDAVDELALKAAAIVGELLDVTAEIGSILDAATRSAEEYSRATGEQLRPIDRRHAFLAVLDTLAERNVESFVMTELLETLLPSSSATSAARLVDAIERALASPEAKPERVAEQRRLLALIRAKRTYNEASFEHQRAERDLEQQDADRALAEKSRPLTWTSAAARYFAPGASALEIQRAQAETERKQ